MFLPTDNKIEQFIRMFLITNFPRNMQIIDCLLIFRFGKFDLRHFLHFGAMAYFEMNSDDISIIFRREQQYIIRHSF